MKKIAIIVLLGVMCMCAHAETIVLRTGARVTGSILFQNEEVVIVRDTNGARFQYMRSDVEEILTNEEVNELESEGVRELEGEEIQTPKKASILLELGGGTVYVPGKNMGAAAFVDLLVGSHHMGDKHIFVGGGVGYHGVFMGEEKYNFLPIEAAVRVPFIEQKHAPVFGVALGYGVALSKDYLGGVYAGVDLGYRCQINPKTAVGLVFYTQFQQAMLKTVETIEEQKFEKTTGCNLLSFGAKFALYF